MNILILSTHLNPGGISRYCLNLAKGLMRRGHNLTVASSGGAWVKVLRNAGGKHKYIPIKTKSFLSPNVFLSLFILIPFIGREKIHLVHANTRVTQFLAYLLHKFCHVPCVSSFHGFYRPSLLRKLCRFPGQRAIAVSRAVKEHLIADLNIKEDKIKIIYSGIDGDEFLGRRNRKESAGFRKSDFLIGILGRLSEEKGHFLAIEAFKILAEKYPNIYLLISGGGRLERKIKEFIKLLALEQRVKAANWPADDFLDLIDLLIVPSRKEGFGFSILEAFAKEVAVIGFNTGGISEIIRHRKDGLLFYNYDKAALKEAMEELFLDKNLRKRIAKEAKKRLRAFSLERMAVDTERVYREVIK